MAVVPGQQLQKNTGQAELSTEEYKRSKRKLAYGEANMPRQRTERIASNSMDGRHDHLNDLLDE